VVGAGPVNDAPRLLVWVVVTACVCVCERERERAMCPSGQGQNMGLETQGLKFGGIEGSRVRQLKDVLKKQLQHQVFEQYNTR
jgi:hypothetical protein